MVLLGGENVEGVILAVKDKQLNILLFVSERGTTKFKTWMKMNSDISRKGLQRYL